MTTTLEWYPPTATPGTLVPVLIVGILEDETEPATHEGFWDGRRWRSVRSDAEGRHYEITSVKLWAWMPSGVDDRKEGYTIKPDGK